MFFFPCMFWLILAKLCLVLPLCCFPSPPWLEFPSPPPAMLQELLALTEMVLPLPAHISWGYSRAAARADL